jgi:hypothetical protein
MGIQERNSDTNRWIRLCALDSSELLATEVPGIGDIPIVTVGDASIFPLPPALIWELAECAVERLNRLGLVPKFSHVGNASDVPYTVYDALEGTIREVSPEAYYDSHKLEQGTQQLPTTAAHVQHVEPSSSQWSVLDLAFTRYTPSGGWTRGTRPLRVVYLSVVNPCRVHNHMFRAIFDSTGKAHHSVSKITAQAVVWHTHMIERRAGYSRLEGCESAVPLRVVPQDFSTAQVCHSL